MLHYQTMLYKVHLLDDFPFGWDYTGEVLFQSQVYDNPAAAMLEFSFADPDYPNWFATMKEIKNGEIVDEEIFDSSVVEID